MLEEKLTEQIIGAAIEVHKHWGPGLDETIYERSLCIELGLREIEHDQQVALPLNYKGISLGEDRKLDVWVEKKVVVENKCVNTLLPIHEAQLLTYMRLTQSRIGLLFNFKVANLTREGIRRLIL